MTIRQRKTKKRNHRIKDISRQTFVFHTLSDVNRFRIFRSLKDGKRLTGLDIAKILKISKTQAVQHLRKLESGDIIVRKRIGRTVYYSLNTGDKAVATVKTVILK